MASVLGFQQNASSLQTDPKELKSIGGYWYLKDGPKPLYLFKDGERYLDLFSYHMKDSNKDGIDNLRISHDDQFLIVNSQGYPNHATAIFPNSRNPNSIEVQDFHFRFPLRPKKADEITRLPMGPIGMALNGVVFFNPFEQEGMNAVEGYSEVWLDACCGHPQQTGVYHYHKYPSCVKSPFVDNGRQHSPLLGFAFDGFPLYGPHESEAAMARDAKGDKALDVCNGHSDTARGYHYHVTPGRFPYILGGYAGVVEPSNNRGLRFARKGAIEDNTQPGSREQPVITSVTPGNLSRGKSHVIRIELEPENIRRGPALPDGKPDWVQFGPFVAKTINREKNVILATFDIPSSASQGVFYDCHIEFGREASPIAIKKNDALRVVE
ncbi:MAG: YHYH protein [bacterium]